MAYVSYCRVYLHAFPEHTPLYTNTNIQYCIYVYLRGNPSKYFKKINISRFTQEVVLLLRILKTKFKL
jgi:hypothetical protein